MREIEYYEKAKEYLLSFDEISVDMLNAHVNEWKSRKPKSISELFIALLNHVKNRQGMPNSIGDIKNLSSILCDFDHNQVVEKYGGWESVFDSIKQSDYSPPGRMDRENNKSHWVIYCKAIISIAEFLSAYKSLEEFQKFVHGFLTNEQSKLALPLLLSEEIFGLGFALACDFLKENVSPEFIKPDTHINELAQRLGITKSKHAYKIFKDVISYCNRIEVLPYEVDKIFWLIGSGKFYLYNIEIKTSKDQFIAMVRHG